MASNESSVALCRRSVASCQGEVRHDSLYKSTRARRSTTEYGVERVLKCSVQGRETGTKAETSHVMRIARGPRELIGR